MAEGRPSLLTPEIIERAKELLPRALYVETVAAQLGITSETFRDWIREGTKENRRREQGQKPDRKRDLHCQFSSTVKKAIADAETDFLSVIQAAGSNAWQALAWVLERRFPQRWATNRGELRALAKQIAAIAKQGTNAKPNPQTHKQTPKVGTGRDPDE